MTQTNPTLIMESKSYRPWSIGGIAFAGCMFIGMGIGYLLNAYRAGMYIGMGMGFLVMAGVLIWGPKHQSNE